jgi:hypothetical protein
VGHPEVEAAVEQDDADRQRHRREEQITEQIVGVEHARQGAGHQADHQQHQDDRDPQPPGHPLSRHPAARDACEGEHGFAGHVGALPGLPHR